MDSATFFVLLGLIPAALATGIFFVSGRLTVFCKKMVENPAELGRFRRQLGFLNQSRVVLWAGVGLMALGCATVFNSRLAAAKREIAARRSSLWPAFDKNKVWQAPDPFLAETDAQGELIAYGRDLVARTQDYFGENGLVRPASINGMNCQNCHLDAGSKPFGNNYFAVESTYPQMRARSGSLETIPKRVNDCFQRSLNGQAIDTTGREMRAILAYLRWLGTGVPKGEKPRGTGLGELPFLDRAADPGRGQRVYAEKCASCHGVNGQGLPMPESARRYPPLWGDRSYNEAAGLFRLSRFASYVKNNMPFGANYQNPQLSDEEAWDVAAFVNAQPRPKHPFLAADWPDIAKKPFDHPFGPYADTFPEAQHKFGPFQPIMNFYKK